MRRQDHYRQIWIKHNGPIPIDENGRTYEIHHVDGNRSNNDISNLICVSIEEHYNIHLRQKDHGACQELSKRMKSSPEQISKHATDLANDRLKSGKHHFLDPEFIKKEKERKKKLAAEGNSPIQRSDVIEKAQKARKEGYLKLNNPLSANNRKKGTCPHCGKTMDIGNLAQHHGDRCKSKVAICHL